MQTKFCIKCGLKKLFSEFYKHSSHKDGLMSFCKDCNNKKGKNYRIKNKKILSQKKKQKYWTNKEENLKNQKIFRLQYPWKVVLSSIKQRTRNKKCKDYKYYGGRGIKCLINEEQIKELWFRDEAYLLKIPSINRKDNDGNYCFDNCEFIEQGKNTEERNKRVIKIRRKNDTK